MIALPVAMHMADGLLSVPVAAVTILVAAVAVALASWRTRKKLNTEKLPLMGVFGAFVFAAQMINFTLPGMPGTSGHLGGGVLLAILLGPAAGIVIMAAILIVQCLIFQDGGLLALGCNIINMGVIACILGWAVYRVVLGPIRLAKPWRLYLAAWAACLVGVTAGSAMVPIEATASGVLRVPTGSFLKVMVAVHLIIAFFEGLITFAVLAYLRRARPASLQLPATDGTTTHERLSRKALAVSIGVTALLLAGVVSWFASTHPDGLEWSYQEHKYGNVESPVVNDSAVVASVAKWHEKWSPLPDYTKRSAPLGQLSHDEPAEAESAHWPNPDGWGSLAGLAGTALTLAIVYLLAAAIRRRRRSQRAAPN